MRKLVVHQTGAKQLNLLISIDLTFGVQSCPSMICIHLGLQNVLKFRLKVSRQGAVRAGGYRVECAFVTHNLCTSDLLVIGLHVDQVVTQAVEHVARMVSLLSR